MIQTKNDLQRCLLLDNGYLHNTDYSARMSYMKRARDAEYYIEKYLLYLRKQEYYRNNSQSFHNKAIALYYERKKNKIGNQLGFYIDINCFDEGLTIFHHGSIIVNPNAKIGKNCKLHGNNCIGNNGITEECPVIGDNVDIGFGAVIIGNVEIANDIIIGANAVVNKSFRESGITIAGVPARKVTRKVK